jgi:hypothetical protein
MKSINDPNATRQPMDCTREPKAFLRCRPENLLSSADMDTASYKYSIITHRAFRPIPMGTIEGTCVVMFEIEDTVQHSLGRFQLTWTKSLTSNLASASRMKNDNRHIIMQSSSNSAVKNLVIALNNDVALRRMALVDDTGFWNYIYLIFGDLIRIEEMLTSSNSHNRWEHSSGFLIFTT